MSGTLIPTMAQPMNPWIGASQYYKSQTDALAPAAAAAGIGKTQAETGEATARAGLIGAQTTGANIQNTLGGLNLQLQAPIIQQQIDALKGTGQQQVSLPWAPIAASGPSGGAPGPGAPAGYLGGAGGGGAPAAPPPVTTGENGVMVPGMGIPMPRQWYVGYLQAQDKPGAMKQIMDSRKALISQMVQGTIGQNGQVDPGMWNQAVEQAYHSGLITSTDAWNYYQHPERATNAVNANLPAGDLPAVRGAQAGASAAGTGAGGAPYEMVKVTVRNADGTTSQVQVPKDQALQATRGNLGGGAPTGAQTVDPNAPISGGDYANRVQAFENPGGNPNLRNPASSAAGPHQFIDSTFVSTLRQARPDLAAGKSDAEILALRNTVPGLSGQMTTAYAAQNAPVLQRNQMPVNATTLGLAHRFGPDGATAVLRAPVDTPIANVVSADVMNRNPDLQGRTTGQVISTFAQHFGLGPVDTGQGGGRQTGGGNGIGAGGVGVGPPVPTVAQEKGMSSDVDRIGKDQAMVQDTQTGALRAQAAMFNLYDALKTLPNAAPGAFGSQRTAVANVLQTFAPEWANKFLAATTNIDPSKAADMQKFTKELFQNTVGAETSGLPGARYGAMLTRFFTDATPNINMQGDAIREMLHIMLVGQQMVRDYSQGAAGHFNNSYGAWRSDPLTGQYTPLTDFDEKWTAPGAVSAPNVYEGAASLLNGRGYGDWSKGMSQEQQTEAVRVAHRADPAWRPVRGQGNAAAPAPAAPALPVAPPAGVTANAAPG